MELNIEKVYKEKIKILRILFFLLGLGSIVISTSPTRGILMLGMVIILWLVILFWFKKEKYLSNKIIVDNKQVTVVDTYNKSKTYDIDLFKYKMVDIGEKFNISLKKKRKQIKLFVETRLIASIDEMDVYIDNNKEVDIYNILLDLIKKYKVQELKEEVFSGYKIVHQIGTEESINRNFFMTGIFLLILMTYIIGMFNMPTGLKTILITLFGGYYLIWYIRFRYKGYKLYYNEKELVKKNTKDDSRKVYEMDKLKVKTRKEFVFFGREVLKIYYDKKQIVSIDSSWNYYQNFVDFLNKK